MGISKSATKLHCLLSTLIFILNCWKYWSYIKNCYQNLNSIGLFWHKAWSHSSSTINAQKQDSIHLLIKLLKDISESSKKCSMMILFPKWFLLWNSSSKILFSPNQVKTNSRIVRAEKKDMSFCMRSVVSEMGKVTLPVWRSFSMLVSRVFTRKCQQTKLLATVSLPISTVTTKLDLN